MAHFTVNGQAVTVEQNQKLLRYLRAVSYTHLDVYKRQP